MKLHNSLKYLGLALGGLLLTAAPGFAQDCRYDGINSGDSSTLVSYELGTPINVRDGASRNAYARHIGYAGDRVVILAQACDKEGFKWYRVQFRQSGAKGWVRGDFIRNGRY
jgi:hypothetical protein